MIIRFGALFRRVLFVKSVYFLHYKQNPFLISPSISASIPSSRDFTVFGLKVNDIVSLIGFFTAWSHSEHMDSMIDENSNNSLTIFSKGENKRESLTVLRVSVNTRKNSS